jgi:hypothetical protein
MNWLDTIKTLAPTVASAFGGPLAGVAISALGDLLGISDATQDKIETAIKRGSLTPEQVAKLKELELQYQENERERGFKYSELEFKDRDSARKANVDGGTQKHMFWLSVILLCVTLGTEVYVMVNGLPSGTSELVVGRVLGLLDSVALMVLAYHYGSSSGSVAKTQLMAK